MGAIKKIMNGPTPMLVRILVWVIGLSLIAGVTWATLGHRVTSNEESIKKLEPKVQDNHDFKTSQMKDNEWIKDTLKRIEDKLP